MKGVKAILLMAGSSVRFGEKTPKQFCDLAGKPLYHYAYHSLLNSQLFEEILLVCPQEKVDEVKRECKEETRVIAGGKTRQESSYLGLQSLSNDTEIVLIHDAARPFVSKQLLEANVAAAKIHHAVNTCIPSSDTLVHTKDQVNIDSIPKREELLRGQTPQTFQYELLLRAHKQTEHTAATDDCQLILEVGHHVHIVEGDPLNRKITTPQDLILAEAIWDHLSP